MKTEFGNAWKDTSGHWYLSRKIRGKWSSYPREACEGGASKWLI